MLKAVGDQSGVAPVNVGAGASVAVGCLPFSAVGCGEGVGVCPPVGRSVDVGNRAEVGLGMTMTTARGKVGDGVSGTVRVDVTAASGPQARRSKVESRK